MKKTAIALLSVIATMMIVGCNDTETYADQKKEESAAINQFISDSSITVISQDQFEAQNYTTDTAKSKNEYVLLNNSGVYMQSVREGCGAKLKDGESATVICRFNEKNIEVVHETQNRDTIQLTDQLNAFSAQPEIMSVYNSSGTFTASFDTNSLMYYAYSSTSVPSGWLVPLSYIKIGRPTNENEEIAKVKLIVPHSEGQAYASQYVYPCYYEITYQRGR